MVKKIQRLFANRKRKRLRTTKTITVKLKNEFINFTANNINSRDKGIRGRGLSGVTVEKWYKWKGIFTVFVFK